MPELMNAKVPPKPIRLWPMLGIAFAVVLVATLISVAVWPNSSDKSGSVYDPELITDSYGDPDEVADSVYAPSQEELAEQIRVLRQEALEQSVAEVLSEADVSEDVEVSVAIRDADFTLTYNADAHHDTASIVKMEVLAMLLDDYDSVEDIPEYQENLARDMISSSDNNSTDELLFHFLDGHEALEAAHEEYGLNNTERGETWGTTQTTALDQLKMLDVLLEPDHFDEGQREFAQELLSDLAEDQEWGVSAAAHDVEHVWMKNGWDTRSDLDENWVVNSVGMMKPETDTPTSIAILTSGFSDLDDAQDIIEELANTARYNLTADPRGL